MLILFSRFITKGQAAIPNAKKNIKLLKKAKKKKFVKFFSKEDSTTIKESQKLDLEPKGSTQQSHKLRVPHLICHEGGPKSRAL